MILKGTTGTQKQVQIPGTDTDSQDILVVRKKYSQKKIWHDRSKNKGLTVSIRSFVRDVHVFDADLAARYSQQKIGLVMKRIFKKVADRIVKKLWRMPFPNGMGSLYMKEAQISSTRYLAPDQAASDAQAEQLLREVELGLKRVFLKWNKRGVRFPYMKLWRIGQSKGYFRSVKFNEIIDRAEDQTRKNYRGHII